MQLVGYAYLIETLKLSAFPLKQEAQVRPVTRISKLSDCLAVPHSVAPPLDNLLAHVLFALKHEGIQLDILSQAIAHIPEQALLDELAQTRSGVYIRKACFLWEAFTSKTIGYQGSVAGSAAPLFDPTRYITGPSIRNKRWRIDFNGLGTLHYCATVERTDTLQRLLTDNILQRAQRFMDSLPETMVDRAIQWAYLHETRDSFAIEQETPSPDKAKRFVRLLMQAHDNRPLSEDYLVELQNSTVSNPYDLAAAFRHEQNHLSNNMRGAAGVTYVPPPPELCSELMQELMAFANQANAGIDPLIAAGIISFGFVFLHPFMDGNGRLSRFLIHQTLCRAGALANGLLLPVSIAMKHAESQYLNVLQGYSKPAREFWDVRWLDAETFTFDFTGHEALYRYWDATACVEFTLEMAQRALDIELREEAQFLARYDHLIKAVNERHDVRGSELAKLVVMCLDNNGVLSQHRRKQFQLTVPAEALDFLEATAQQLLSAIAQD